MPLNAFSSLFNIVYHLYLYRLYPLKSKSRLYLYNTHQPIFLTNTYLVFTMGLIKAAILIGAGTYAIKKFTKSREHHHCCKHSKNMPEGEEKSLQGGNGNAEFLTGGNRGLPEYADTKEYQQFHGVREKDGWMGSEKELGGMRGNSGA